MSKERRTVSLDPEVEEYLSQEGVNASELVNNLVETHVSAGGNEKAMLELREQQLESEVAELESRTETKQEELAQVRDRLSEFRDKREDVIQEARNTLEDIPLEPDNPAVQNWAGKAEMPVDEFIAALENDST